MDKGLSPAQKQQVRQSFLGALTANKPTVSYTASDAKRGGSFYQFGVGKQKAIVAQGGGRRLRSETGSFL